MSTRNLPINETLFAILYEPQPHTVIQRIPIQQFREVLHHAPVIHLIAHSLTDIIFRYRRNNLHTLGGTSQGDIQDIDIIHILHQHLISVMRREQRFLAPGRKDHIVYSSGNAVQSSTFHIGAAPFLIKFIQLYPLCKRHYDIREVQALGLMHGHYPDGITSLRRTDALLVSLPILEERMKAVAVLGQIVLKDIHEGLDIQDLRVKHVLIVVSQLSEQVLTQIYN